MVDHVLKPHCVSLHGFQFSLKSILVNYSFIRLSFRICYCSRDNNETHSHRDQWGREREEQTIYTYKHIKLKLTIERATKRSHENDQEVNWQKKKKREILQNAKDGLGKVNRRENPWSETRSILQNTAVIWIGFYLYFKLFWYINRKIASERSLFTSRLSFCFLERYLRYSLPCFITAAQRFRNMIIVKLLDNTGRFVKPMSAMKEEGRDVMSERC